MNPDQIQAILEPLESRVLALEHCKAQMMKDAASAQEELEELKTTVGCLSIGLARPKPAHDGSTQ